MTTTVIFDPCGSCAGRGSIEEWSPEGMTTPAGPSGAWIRCESCGGSGKGRVREIREEREPGVYPDVWPVLPKQDLVLPPVDMSDRSTCGGIPGSVVK